MRAKNIRECLWYNQAAEATEEAEEPTETWVRVSGPDKGGGVMGVGGKVEVGVVHGSGADYVQRRSAHRLVDLAGGGTDPKRGRRIPRHTPRGGGLEGGSGDSK